MNRLLIVAVVAFGLMTESHAQDAPKPKALSWEALKAESELFIDPFAELSPKQLQDLSYVRRVRWLIGESKLSAESSDAVKAEKISRRLEKEGVDIAWLMVQRKRIRDLRDHQVQTHAASVVESLKAQRVVLNGFAVPIFGSSEGECEFFLVPSIDFCNAAAPPSTQVIHVKSSQGPTVDDRTTPLQVTGTLVQRTTKRSFIFPGQTLHYEADYAIEPTEIKLVDWRTNREQSR